MLYVYAITANGRETLPRELRRVPLARGSAMSAVVAEVAGAPDVTPEALRAHDGVVQTLLRRCDALLPARFGATAADDAELQRTLAPRAGDFAAALGLVRGCVQMSVRIFGRAAAAAAAGPRARVSAAKADAGTRYLLQKAEEWKAAESLPEIEPLRIRLAGLVRASRIERHQTPGLIGTAHHLVDRTRLPAYRAALQAGARLVSPVRVHATGPWAPYAFAPGSLA